MKHAYAWVEITGKVFVDHYELAQRIKEKFGIVETDDDGVLELCTYEQKREAFEELAKEKASELFPTDGRRKLSASLPREAKNLVVAEAEKSCPDCGKPRIHFDTVISERLGYRGPAYYVVEYRRFKYVCRGCASAPITAALPPEILPKASADPSLLAHIIVSKFVDHLPLHRHESILARHGLTVSRSTLGGLMAGCAQALLPLYQVMATLVRQSKIVHTDDTPVTQLDRNHAAGRVTGRVWVYLGDRDHPYTVFDATSSRSRDGPVNFLKDFHGYLQADAFGGYDGLYANGVTEVACWAHARRKFVDAKENAPAEAHQALARSRLAR